MRFFGIFDDCCKTKNLEPSTNGYFQCGKCKRIFIQTKSDKFQDFKNFIQLQIFLKDVSKIFSNQ